MAAPRFRLGRSHKVTRRSTLLSTTASTNWTDTDTALDIVLAAQVGDDIEVQASGQWDSEAAVYAYMDVVSVVSSAPVNSFGQNAAVTAGSGVGIPGWMVAPSVRGNIAGGIVKTLVSGDISSGTVTLRLRHRMNSATSRDINQLAFWAKNLGPADPN